MHSPGTPGAGRDGDLDAESGLEPRDVVLIGDIHGWSDRIRTLWVRLEAKLGQARLARAVVVLLGDYVDRGPDSRGVLDFLIHLKETRDAAGRVTRFIAGNHDFGMACFLGTPPIDEAVLRDVDLDSTHKETQRSCYQHEVDGGMHTAGRRWGGSTTYQNTAETFRSYGVDLESCIGCSPESRELFIERVPEEHKRFLASLEWCADLEMGPHIQPGGRVLCVHAGLVPTLPLEPQLEALKARDVAAPVLQTQYLGYIDAFSAKLKVMPQHPELKGKAVLVSGHHATRFSTDGTDEDACCEPGLAYKVPVFAERDAMNGERLITDFSGGWENKELEALVLPSREVIGSG